MHSHVPTKNDDALKPDSVFVTGDEPGDAAVGGEAHETAGVRENSVNSATQIRNRGAGFIGEFILSGLYFSASP
jgi:hypothetical protein